MMCSWILPLLEELPLHPAQVRIYKKSAFEKLPPLKTKSKEGAAAGGGLTSINTSVEMFRVGGGDGAAAGEDGEDDAMAEGAEPVPPDQQTRAYR